MKHLKRNLTALILAALLLACGAAIYWTREAGVERRSKKPLDSSLPETLAVDQKLLATARHMADLAETPDEQALAHEVARLADRELDLAFAGALREAAAQNPTLSGPAKQAADRIASIKARLAKRQELVAKLSKADASDSGAADQLDLAKAQMTLDQDELDDAREDLARAGGDRRSTVERALQEHEAQHKLAPQQRAPARRPAASLYEQIEEWLSLRGEEDQVESAQRQVASRVTALDREHLTLEKLLQGQTVAAPAAAADDETANPESDEEDTTVMIARLRQLSDQRKTLTDLDKRVQDLQQLAGVYQRWLPLIDTRKGRVTHLALISLAFVLGTLLTVVAASFAIRVALARHADRRRVHQLRTISTTALQVAGLLVILIIAFGPPSQLSTIIGIATAGLTVVMKDFIVAFFGWFVLMGKNGVRLGDWVEIEGVGGEVIEIGLLKTVLLEMGDWTNTGHPTGRRVDFVNKFAIEKHYFNFSTAGRWLWDELVMTLPASSDPYHLALRLRDEVERITADNAALAEKDWERVTAQYETRPFSARPAVDLRPSANGLEVRVRYITRAPERYEVKSRLFEAIVGMVHSPPPGSAPTSEPLPQ